MLATLLSASAAAPQEISWSTVDGGGTGSAASGALALRATAGQPDAGSPLAGGLYTLRGGFWPGERAFRLVLFADGFESGDSGAWSNVIPAVAAERAQAQGAPVRDRTARGGTR